MVVGIAWNAGVVRARLLARRRLGAAGCHDLARCASFEDALRSLRDGPYSHDLEPEMTLPAAQWAVGATPLWHLRVLAGWLPPAGGELVRTLAGWWEVMNIENLMAGFAGAQTFPPYELGPLDTAWDRVRTASSPDQVRAELAASPWLDPGAEELPAIVTWLQLSWAHHVAEDVEPAARLAAGWAALVAARDLLLGGATHAASTAHRIRELGWDWADADDLRGLTRLLPGDAAWILDDVHGTDELWRAEVRWWRTLDEDGRGRLQRADSGPDAVVGAFCVLLADAHRVQGALELAARTDIDEEVVGAIL